MKLNINVSPFGVGCRRKSDHLLWKIVGGASRRLRKLSETRTHVLREDARP